MNKVMVNIAAVVVLTASTVVAVASEKTYIGAQYATGTYSDDVLEEMNLGDISPTALIARLGVHLNNNVSIETRYGIGLQSDSINVMGLDIFLDLDSLLGVYAVGRLNPEEVLTVYGVMGFTNAEATVSAPGFVPVTVDESGFSFGAGVEVSVDDNFAFNIEYMQYLNKDDFTFSAIGLGAVVSF